MPFKLCDKKFFSKTNFQRHVKSVHEKIRDFKCEFCLKSLGSAVTLKKHLEAIHNNEIDQGILKVENKMNA